MNIYRITFIGHRDVEHYKEIEEYLYKNIPEILEKKDFVEFQIGRNGEFDIFVASCIKRIQKRYNYNSVLTLVLPYKMADIEYYEKYYDNIIIPEDAELAHPKAAIIKRNQWMINNSDLLTAYIRRENGGAAKCIKMAEKRNIKIVRI